ncbi:MAG: amidohydrolase family protein [Pseudomonadota bacterium]
MRWTYSLVLLLLIHSGAFATDYVTAGRLLDVRSGDVLEKQVLTIVDGRITAVTSQADTSIPDDSDHLDLSDYFVTPGFMDAHVHLHGSAKIQGYRNLGMSQATATLWGVVNARKTLHAGFTTVRQVGAPGFADVALRDMIDSGELTGPRMLVGGPSIGITGGHCSDNNLLPFDRESIGDGVADGPWRMRAIVRRNIKFGVDVIKTCSTGGVLSKGTEVGAPQSTVEELTALVEEAHSHGRKVASHAHGTTGIKNALKAGVDSIEHASFIDDEGIRMAKRQGTYLVMDIYNTEYILGEGEKAGFLAESLAKERRTGATQRANFQKAHEAGVKMAFGSDAGVYPHGDNARQFSRMVRFGMTPLEALQAATINTADLFGRSEDIGELVVGKYADFVAFSASPLQDISITERPSFVVKGGEVVKTP